MDRNRNDTFQQTRFDIERREGQSQEILREASLKFPQMHGEVLDQPCSLSYEFRHFVVSLVAETDERVIKVRVPLVVRKFRAGFHRFGSVRLRKEQATRVLERCIRLVLGRVAWFIRSFGVQTRIPRRPVRLSGKRCFAGRISDSSGCELRPGSCADSVVPGTSFSKSRPHEI